MKFAFRADASVEIGAGHITRCVTLARSLVSSTDAEVVFFCKSHEGNLIDFVAGEGFEVISMPVESYLPGPGDPPHAGWVGGSQVADAETVRSHLEGAVDWMIVDHYGLDARWHTAIRQVTGHILVIDDTFDRDFDCDLLLNSAIGVDESFYRDRLTGDCSMLLGPDYVLLRPEFLTLRARALEKRQQTSGVKKVLVFLGGSDPDNVTEKIVVALKKLGTVEDVMVVMGASAPHRQRVQALVDDDARLDVVVDLPSLAELIMEYDCCFGAAGSSAWERCVLGMPTAMSVNAINQQQIARGLESRGAVLLLGWHEDIADVDVETALEVFNNQPRYEEMSRRASQVCDGRGTERVLQRLLEI